MPGESFAGTWEIGTSSMAVWEFVTVTSLAGVGLRASMANVEALESSESLDDVWKMSFRGPWSQDIYRIFPKL